jgi:hypothetical protein
MEKKPKGGFEFINIIFLNNIKKKKLKLTEKISFGKV